MDHNTCRDNLSAYLDGELPQREKTLLEAHLAGCPDCRAVLGQLGAVSGIIKKHVMEPVPLSLKREVLAGPRKTEHPWLKPVLALSTAAAGVLVLFNLAGEPERKGALQLLGFNNAEPLRSSMNVAETLPAAEAGRALSPEEAAAPAQAAGDAGMPAVLPDTGLIAESETREKRAGARSAAASVRGGYGQAKFTGPSALGSLGGRAAGAKAVAADKIGSPKNSPAGPAVAEFRGPVCVYVSSARSNREASESMGEEERDDFFWYLGKAILFIEKTGIPSPSAEPGNLVFVKKNGGRRTVTKKECDLGFVFFDGVQDPLVVTEFIFITEQYNKYFGTSYEPLGDDLGGK